MKTVRYLLPFIGIAVILALVFHKSLFGSSGPSDRSVSIQATIGADACSSSGFQIVSKINSEKDTIYNCDMPSGKTICVTEANGIDNDVTATVRLLFASTLGSGKPTCIS